MSFQSNGCCVFTIVSKNYISQARALMKSFLKYHGDVRQFVLLADKVDGYFDPRKEPFELIEADVLEIRNFESFSFKYNIIEFSTAVKPFFFEYLFQRYGFKKIIYLDPDILVFRPFTEIFEALDTNAVVLTPHILKPVPDDGCSPREIDILKAGVFNLGFIALSEGENTNKLLSWWKERLYDKCLQSVISGYAVDQIWMSLAPCFFDDHYILRKPGYNVAYWNLHERSITQNGDEVFINDTPLYFFHFSGFNIDNPDIISKYQNRFRLADIPGLRDMFERYRGILLENGYRECSIWPYHYGYFQNGSRISDSLRSLYWGLGPGSGKFGNPFNTFYRKLFNFYTFRSIFRERFLRALLDRFLLYGWKSLLRRRR